jgi:4-aminobutyrate aminotransferase-like enzyme
VWGIQCATVGSHDSAQVANACVRTCYLGDQQGRAVHLLGPLAGDVIRVSPPLVMPIDEAREYLDVMYNLFVSLRQSLDR